MNVHLFNLRDTLHLESKHLFLDGWRQSGEEVGVNSARSESFRLFALLLRSLLNALKSQLLSYHLLTNAVGQGRQKTRVDAFW